MCPYYNSFKICSYAVATADINKGLKECLKWYKEKNRRISHLMKLVRTDIPQCPGSKGKVNCQKRKIKQLPIQDRIQRAYSDVTPFKFEPFRLKKMNLKITVCQGYHGKM